MSYPASPTVGQQATENGRLYQWSGYAWELVANVSGHAATHAAAGSDPITPAAIGAAAASHTHTAGDITGLRIASWTMRDNQPPATNFATLDTRNSQLVLAFDAATQESATFVGVVPENCTLSSGVVVRVWWMGATATTGNVRWGVSVERTGTDMDSDSFDAVTEATGATSSTSGIETLTAITVTAIDGLSAGDKFRLRVARIAADATNDTMAGDAQLVAVEARVA